MDEKDYNFHEERVLVLRERRREREEGGGEREVNDREWQATCSRQGERGVYICLMGALVWLTKQLDAVQDWSRTGHHDDASDKRLFGWTTSKMHHKTMLRSSC